MISGPDTEQNHCIFEHNKGHVILDPLESTCAVNGNAISKPTRLFQGENIKATCMDSYKNINHHYRGRQRENYNSNFVQNPRVGKE